MEHHEEMEFIPSASLEVDHVHDAIGFLKEIESSLILFSLDESVCAVIELSHYNRNFIF